MKKNKMVALTAALALLIFSACNSNNETGNRNGQDMPADTMDRSQTNSGPADNYRNGGTSDSLSATDTALNETPKF